MQTRISVASFVTVLLACSGCQDRAPDRGSVTATSKETAERMAELSPKPEQRKLWQEVSKAKVPPTLDKQLVADDPVRKVERLRVDNRAVAFKDVSFPENVRTAVVVRSAPRDLQNRFSGEATVVSSKSGNFVISFGARKQDFVAQIKAGGQRLRFQPGEKIQVRYQAQDALGFDSFLSLASEGNRFTHTRVARDKPVRLELPDLGLTAVQSEDGTSVELAIGEDRQTASSKQPTVRLEQAGVTVDLLQSMVVPESSLAVAPGPRFRLELAGWTKGAAGDEP